MYDDERRGNQAATGAVPIDDGWDLCLLCVCQSASVVNELVSASEHPCLTRSGCTCAALRALACALVLRVERAVRVWVRVRVRVEFGLALGFGCGLGLGLGFGFGFGSGAAVTCESIIRFSASR